MYSHQDFTGQNLKKREIEPQVIRGSCFSQEIPDSDIFPDGMQGVTFISCNLDNVFIPDGNTVIECSQRRFQVQEDGYDWILDADNNPIERIG